MKIILTLIAIFGIVVDGYQIACSTYHQNNCFASGYCDWISGVCKLLECHKVTEPRACSGKLSGYLYQNQRCKISPNLDPKFQNLCIEYDQDTLMWGYLVYPQDNTQNSTYTTASGFQISKISTNRYPTQVKSEILTLNILKAKNNDLLNIMYGYLQQSNELCNDDNIPIAFLEKAIYESMQQIRDDETISYTSTTFNKFQFHLALWGMTDAFFQKLRKQKLNMYISYKYLINFGFANLKLEKIVLETQFQVFEITWEYVQPGYLEVLVMPAEQFGFYSIHSDIIVIRASDLNGYTIVNQRKLQFYHRNQQAFFSKTLHSIDLTNMQKTNTSIVCSPFSSCGGTLSGQGRRAYIFGDKNINDCGGRSQSECRLGKCNWTDSTGNCT
ncbi:unnamed protein product (macronuclear) [Paramecium tetraurelia]|uniref:Uncharacterized protein n=1 Tax=Paramecium tetraurelia TaxID=5888 RepID=A0D4R7_PARTE|nr:uncharacterized protein GSPATT00013481001 [Paramecium tetraurelia]CAK78034.1 unnamed protein product [Paramecium tetraurelia]|eukprot:XP_001445431.1 hypothetical protein (macronuclear) [Paramecium tetraurelia strain d4-2]